MNRTVVAAALAVTVFVLSRYWPGGDLPLLFSLVAQTIGYAAMIAVYWSLPRLLFSGDQVWFWAMSVAGAAASLLLVESGFRGDAVAAWSALIAASLITARGRQADAPLSHIGFAGALAVIAGSLLWVIPNLQVMTLLQQEQFAQLQEQWKGLLGAAVGSQVEREALLEQLKLVSKGVIRLLPATLVLSWLVQYLIGLLLFLRATELLGMRRPVQPFAGWHLPFWLNGVLIIAALGRLLGTEQVAYWADNLLAVLAVVYSVGGLSIGEFFMRRFRFGLFMKGAIYLMLFLSGLVGCLLLIALGFFDSALNWRNRPEQGNELANEDD